MPMAFQCFYKRGPQRSTSKGEDIKPELKPSEIHEVHITTNWDDVTCPVCLDYPHNGVLLQCSSYEKGCRPFICDTNHLHSNCLERFKTACGMPSESNPPSTSYPESTENSRPMDTSTKCKPICPLCRGSVNGWVVIDKAREYLDKKTRYCDEERCSFVGTYTELQKHAQEEHPDSQPSKIDPARQLDWENFQQSSEMVDVLSSIHSEVPRGVVLGDYVIEYGDDTSDEFEDFPGDEGNWWTSCILYQVFDNLRNSRNRRSRSGGMRRDSRRSSNDTSNSDDGSVTSVEFPDYRGDETDDEFGNARSHSRSNFNRWRLVWPTFVCWKFNRYLHVFELLSFLFSYLKFTCVDLMFIDLGGYLVGRKTFLRQGL